MQFIAREGEAPAEPWRASSAPVVYQTNWRCKVLTGGPQNLRLSQNQNYSNRTDRIISSTGIQELQPEPAGQNWRRWYRESPPESQWVRDYSEQWLWQQA